MSKKLILFLIIFTFLFGFKLARAEVKINEFVSNSGDEQEWVELLNNGDSPVNLDGWTIRDGNNREDDILLKGTLSNLSGSNILVKYHDKGWLNDGGDLIELYNNSSNVPVYSIVYGKVDGKTATTGLEKAPNFGKSGALINGEWKFNQEPTKGQPNPSSATNTSSDENDDSSDDEDADDEEIETTVPVLKTKILAPTTVFVGQPVKFSTEVKYGTSTYLTGIYFWNFGDGDSKTMIDQSGEILHTYFYPGEYSVSLEYFRKTSFLENPDAINEIVVKVVPMTVSISKVGDAKDFFVELTNNADYKIDISGWKLINGNQYFTLPKNTIILPKKSIIISGKVSGFVFGNQENLKLTMPTREVVYDYGALLMSAKFVSATSSKVSPKKNIAKALVVEELNKNSEEIVILENEIPAENLLASAVFSDQNLDNSKSSNFLVIILTFVLGIGGASIVYFIRRRKGISDNGKAGEDFSILDE